jgi:CRP-like cAMP-binding protein
MPFRQNDTHFNVRDRAHEHEREHACTRTPDIVLRRYAALAQLSADDVALLHDLKNGQAHVAAGQEIEREGMDCAAPRLIAAGWACRFRMLSDGRRMILAFLLPGDSVSMRPRANTALVSAAALTDCRVIDASPIWKAIHASDQAYPGLAAAQNAMIVQDESYLLDHIVRLGRQTARERVCHLLLEFHNRLQAVGLVRGREFSMPLTQETLADAVGLSIVHMNRTLQRLRRERMIECRRGCVALLEPERMAAIAEFNAPPQLAMQFVQSGAAAE